MSRAWRLIGLPMIAAGLIAAMTLTSAFAMGGGYYGGYSSGSSGGYTSGYGTMPYHAPAPSTGASDPPSVIAARGAE